MQRKRMGQLEKRGNQQFFCMKEQEKILMVHANCTVYTLTVSQT